MGTATIGREGDSRGHSAFIRTLMKIEDIFIGVEETSVNTIEYIAI